jgi:16S rRNA (uracil1498-N3)-methyltransferase
LTVAVEEVRREENEAAGIVLVQGLAKGGRDEAAVEAATGLGVERIVPWAAARSVVRWVGAKADRGRARWEAIARAETKVARRSWIPVVTPVATTADLVGAPQTPAVLAGAHIVVLHEDASTPFVAEVHRLLPLRRPLALVVGPEGGIGEEELAAFAGAGATAVRLGAAVLRSGAAGPAALAALAALRGAWS